MDPEKFNPMLMILDGLSAMAEQHVEEAGSLRAGNAGIADDVMATGSCPRKAYARLLGKKIERHSLDTLMMFEGGVGNELLVEKNIRAALPHGVELKRESETPTFWTIRDVPVTGRPDAVFYKDGKPIHVLELKKISATNSASQNAYEPKLTHLVQAAHYAWALGLQNPDKKPIPATLVYSNREKHFPASWAKISTAPWFLSQCCEMRTAKKSEGMVVKNILPYQLGYRIRIDDIGNVTYQHLDMYGIAQGEPQDTIVSIAGIKRFYELVLSLKDLPDIASEPRSVPTNVNALGEKYRWTDCDYCALKPLCTSFSGGIKEWVYSAMCSRDESNKQ